MKMVSCGRCGKPGEFKAVLRYELNGSSKSKDVCEVCFTNFQLWWGALPVDVEVKSDRTMIVSRPDDPLP